MMNFYSLKGFFDVASPQTLISLIRDIDDIDNPNHEQKEIKAKAKVILASIFGDEGMEELTRPIDR